MPADQSSLIETFARDGFALLKAAVSDAELQELTKSIAALRSEDAQSAISAGARLLLQRSEAVRRFANSRPMRRIAESIVGVDAKPVKAILFDKTVATNWYVTWHQDLTIAVKQRADVEGFGPWSIKEGIPHVQPPLAVLEKMVAFRVHLDDCSADNGAIKFLPGSQSVGVLDPSQIATWRADKTEVCCDAERGDIILMRPLILHSSSKSTNPEHRRVLHIEYTGAPLPADLEWAEASGQDARS